MKTTISKARGCSYAPRSFSSQATLPSRVISSILLPSLLIPLPIFSHRLQDEASLLGSGGASVSGHAFFDSKDDRTQDPEDSGSRGVRGLSVSLRLCDNGRVVEEGNTDDAGRYSFGDLDAGEYYIDVFAVSDQYAFADEWKGSEETAAGGAPQLEPVNAIDPNTGSSACFELEEGENMTISIGLKFWAAESLVAPGPSQGFTETALEAVRMGLGMLEPTGRTTGRPSSDPSAHSGGLRGPMKTGWFVNAIARTDKLENVGVRSNASKHHTEGDIATVKRKTEGISCDTDPGTTLFKVEILTDDYGGETHWTLYNEDGSTVRSGPGCDGCPDRYQNNALYIHQWCLPDETEYKFVIFDSWGDGLSCGYAWYKVFYDNSLVKSGKVFGLSESTLIGGVFLFLSSSTTSTTSSNPSISNGPSSTPTLRPSISNRPSTSSSPSASTIPSTTLNPSFSNRPSTSSIPSASIIPSTTLNPSISDGPSTSSSPSASTIPSTTLNPSFSNRPSTSSSPSASTIPTTTLIPSSSNRPSTSLSPSASTIPSTTLNPSVSVRPSTSLSPSVSTIPTTTLIPSIRNRPSISLRPDTSPSLSPSTSPSLSLTPSSSYPTSSPDASSPASSPDASSPASSPDASSPASSPDASSPASSLDASPPASSPVASFPVSIPVGVDVQVEVPVMVTFLNVGPMEPNNPELAGSVKEAAEQYCPDQSSASIGSCTANVQTINGVPVKSKLRLHQFLSHLLSSMLEVEFSLIIKAICTEDYDCTNDSVLHDIATEVYKEATVQLKEAISSRNFLQTLVEVSSGDIGEALRDAEVTADFAQMLTPALAALAQWYPNWKGRSETCMNDGNAPMYMKVARVYFFEETIEACCDRYYAWNLVDCLGDSRYLPKGYYPNWDSVDIKCLNDTETMPRYLNNLNQFLKDDVESCCGQHYNWAYKECLVGSGIGSVGSSQWYVDWKLSKCVKDCDDPSDMQCGGLANSWDELGSVSECCNQLTWIDRSECIN